MIVLTGSVSYRVVMVRHDASGGWEYKQGGAVYNAKTATLCGPFDGKAWTCIDMRNGDTVSALDRIIAEKKAGH